MSFSYKLWNKLNNKMIKIYRKKQYSMENYFQFKLWSFLNYILKRKNNIETAQLEKQLYNIFYPINELIKLEKLSFLSDDLKLSFLQEKLPEEKLSFVVEAYLIQKRYEKSLHRIQQKIKNNEKLKVCFIGYQEGAACDIFTPLYKEFKKDQHFDVSIIILPYNYDSLENMKRHQEESYEYLKTLGISAIKGYDEEKNNFVNHDNKYDIVFFEVAYDWVAKEFTTDNFPDAITFYLPYGQFLADNIQHHFNQKMMSKLYCIYPPSKSVAEMMKKYSLINGMNISNFYGNPKIQLFFDKQYKPKNKWKKQEKTKKKIIWAPHHMWANYSNFMQYKDFFIQLAEKYKDTLQIAFKPHPALKSSLKEKQLMSEDEVDEYYKKWNNMPNTQLETGGWTDLFLTSDAMILDSIAFMLEYSLTGNPSCVLYREDQKGERIMKFSECGEEVFELLYRAKTYEECEDFIKRIVIDGNDIGKEEREFYIRKNYLPPHNNSAELNIFNDVKQRIGIK